MCSRVLLNSYTRVYVLTEEEDLKCVLAQTIVCIVYKLISNIIFQYMYRDLLNHMFHFTSLNFAIHASSWTWYLPTWWTGLTSVNRHLENWSSFKIMLELKCGNLKMQGVICSRTSQPSWTNFYQVCKGTWALILTRWKVIPFQKTIFIWLS